jgi:hypothetical protein
MKMNRKILGVGSISIILLTIATILNYFFEGEILSFDYDPSRLYIQIVYSFVIALASYQILIHVKNIFSFRILFTIFFFSVLFVFYYFVSIYDHGFSMFVFSNFAKSIFWLFGFFLFYYSFLNEQIPNYFIKVYILFYIILTFISICTFVFSPDRLLPQASNDAYNLLLALPLLMIAFEGKMRYCLLALVIFGIILSVKRGAIICLLFSLPPILRNELKKLNQIKFIVLSLILIGSVIYLSQYFVDAFIFRFTDLITPEKGAVGSGRGEFYKLIINGWLEGSFFNKIFGFGFFSVPGYLNRAYGMQIVAHSDWLEILYSFGIFGMLIYISLLFQLFKLRKLVRHYIPKFYDAYIVFIVILFIKSIFSHSFYSTQTINYTLFFAFIYSQLFLMKKRQVTA